MKFILLRLLLCGLAVAVTASVAQAQVGPNGFTASVRLDIRATPAIVYDALVHVGQWWSPAHTYSGDAKNMSIDARPGGCFCERLADGGGVEHLRVIYVAPGKMLRMSGGLGPLQALGVSGNFSVELKPAPGGTTLELVYAVGGFTESGFNQLAPAVQGVVTEQMNRLKSYVETGRPTRN